MVKRESTAPFLFFFLDLPSGISSGFASITLPFVLTQARFSVAAASAIVALGVSANLWRFLWGPIADLTLTAERWYLIGLITTATTLLLLSVIPLRTSSSGLIYAVVFISQVASTLVMLPQGGLMAHTVAEEAKGRAAGWYQAGNLGGNGIGGGAGVWLAAHYSKEIAGAALAISMLACALALFFVADVRIVTTETLRERMLLLWRDLVAIVTAAIPLLITILVCSPIGAGAMNNVWAAVAPDWHASADMVALVTGVLNGVVAAVGCVVGGWIADRVGFWWTYFSSGIAIAAVAIIMAIAARTPASFSVGVLSYAFTNGVAYAAFSALVLLAIGKGAASTKYAALCSLGNLPVVYMTALDGWVHDRYGAASMLHFDGLAGVVCIVFAMLALHLILRRRAALIP
jgi:MFS transporter, PAT family, beta-lactamase induction signal transducer AmpG